jgi:phospholipid transport system substrate-binding protein
MQMQNPRRARRGGRAHGLTLLIALVLAVVHAPGRCAAAEPPAAAASLDSQVDASGPAQLVQTTAAAILKELEAHRAEYRKDPARVHQLVDQVLLPHFDTEYSARLVLGRHWTAATPEQRTRFIAAFYKSLLDNYGDALVDFTGDRLKVLPYTGDPAATNATVRTQIRKDDGSNVAVNYSLRHTDAGWKAWDLAVEGISYVKSFRDDFGAQIEQQGLDAVIAKLESGAKPGGGKGPPGTG